VTRPAAEARARWLLPIGIGLGIALTALGIGGEPSPAPPPDAVALVNGQPIDVDAFERYVRAVTPPERRNRLDDADRSGLLRQMIDEELLVQRGIALGLARADPAARRAVLSLMIRVLTGAAGAQDPDEETLRAFHAAHPERFGGTRLELEAELFAVGERSEAEAYREASSAARRARAGGAMRDLRELLPDANGEGANGEESGLSLDAIRTRLGVRAAGVAAELEPGDTSSPVRTPRGWLVLRLEGRAPGPPAPFETVRDEVRAAVQREQSAAALERYTEDLYDEAEIVVLDPALAP
jgi:hypothetical protein